MNLTALFHIGKIQQNYIELSIAIFQFYFTKKVCCSYLKQYQYLKGVGPVRADFGLKFQVHLTNVFGHFLNT